MSEELKPCPFCGGEAAHDKWDEDRDYAGCRKCDFWAHARIWNNRTQDSELAALRTKLEEAPELYTMRLAAISTASLANSRQSAPPIDITHPYWTPSYGDVVAAVKREMEWREKAEAAERHRDDALAALSTASIPIANVTLSGDAEHYKAKWEEAERKLAEAARWSNEWAAEVARVKAEFSELVVSHTDLLHQLQRALDAEKTARAEGMEEAAQVCAEDESGRDSGGYFADAIRAKMKEQK